MARRQSNPVRRKDQAATRVFSALIFVAIVGAGAFGYTRYVAPRMASPAYDELQPETLPTPDVRSANVSIEPSGMTASEKVPTQQPAARPSSASSPRIDPPASSLPADTPRTACDGRTRCGQMKSCEEATYFIQNCPNTQMDGDNDGIPCESQWCN